MIERKKYRFRVVKCDSICSNRRDSRLNRAVHIEKRFDAIPDSAADTHVICGLE